jgi:hypothetical protein
MPKEQQNHAGLQPLRRLFSFICNSAAAKAGFFLGHDWHD